MTTASTMKVRSPWTPPMRIDGKVANDESAVLREVDWAAVAAALAQIRSNVGRPFRDERRTVEAVIWRARHGARWREIPEATFGPWWRAAQLYYRWEKTGLWARLQAALRDAGREDLAVLFVSESDDAADAVDAGNAA